MSARARRFLRRIADIASRAGGSVLDLTRYHADPVGYAKVELGVEWWAKQQAIAHALVTPPYRVLVKASHSVGKSHVAAGLVNWWYDSHDPSICITTAPKFDQVKDVLWKEVRLQRRGRGGFPGPKMPRLESAPDHYAVGVTADRGEGMQGQHGPAVLIVLDEAVGVPPYIWEAADSMCQGVEYGILAICNPTDTTSEFYRREQQTEVPWHVISISCLEHPNIAAELAGQRPPFPAAVRLAWVEERIREWCERVVGEPEPTDIEFPPGSGQWWRPGPDAEARLLGRWPSKTFGVWSDALFGRAEAAFHSPPVDEYPVIGCDVARFGDDYTAIHVRCGPVSLYHESVNGQAVDATAGRLRQLAGEWAAWQTARRVPQAAPLDLSAVPIYVDDNGVGGGVVDILRTAQCRVIPVNAASEPNRPDRYPNTRSELWFALAERARLGRLSFARLGEKDRRRIKVQAMSPSWRLDAAGRRVVEPKDVTKKDTGRSPDDMDAVNLSYRDPLPSLCPTGQNATPQPPAREVRDANASRRGLWGRR